MLVKNTIIIIIITRNHVVIITIVVATTTTTTTPVVVTIKTMTIISITIIIIIATIVIIAINGQEHAPDTHRRKRQDMRPLMCAPGRDGLARQGGLRQGMRQQKVQIRHHLRLEALRKVQSGHPEHVHLHLLVRTVSLCPTVPRIPVPSGLPSRPWIICGFGKEGSSRF